MRLRVLDRKPTAYEVTPEGYSASPISVDMRGTVNVPAFARLSAAEAKEVAMSVLFAAALANLEMILKTSSEKEKFHDTNMGPQPSEG